MDQLSAAPNAARYKDISRLALAVGENLASHGADSSRVEDTAKRILETTGFSYTEVHASVTGITISLADASIDHEVSLTKCIRSRDNDLSQISLTNNLSRSFVSGALSIDQAFLALEKLKAKRYYPRLLVILSYAIIAVASTFMLQGTPKDALASFLVGLGVGLVECLLGKLRMLGFVRCFLSAAALGLFSLFFVSYLPVGENLYPILSGSLMPLVPGVTFTVAIQDLLHKDYLSGVSRGVEAILYAVFLAAGMSVVVRMFHRGDAALFLSEAPNWFTWGRDWILPPEILFQAAASFLMSLGLAILFHAQPGHLVACGLTGAATWFVYCLFARRLSETLLAVFLAALTASVLSYALARFKKAPITVFFIGGVFCLVPGSDIYRSMYYFLGSDFSIGGSFLIHTLEVSALIAIAMAIHRSIVALLPCRRDVSEKSS